MAPLSNHATLTITQDSLGIARAGFGVPLHLSYSAAWAERVRSYSSLAEVAVDFPTTTSPEYLAASAFFSQSPRRPSTIKIGRGALKPTQVYTLIPAVLNSTAYKINVKGQGVTATQASFTSDASATLAEIIAGLVSALNAVTGNNFLAVDTGPSTSIVVTGDAAGSWFSLEPVDATQWTDFGQTHADPGIATDLAAIALEDDDWYGLHTAFNSNALVLAAAGWVETAKKIYVVDVNETDAITTAAGNSDTLDDLATAARVRTMGCYHPDPAAMFAAAWMGRVLPVDPGSVTWKFKRLSGPAAVVLTSSQRANLIARNANSYETVAGISITFEGKASDGEFFDVVRGDDWLEDDMTKGVFGALAANDIVPFTDEGIALVEAEMRASLERATTRGILATGWTVTVPAADDVATADKAARLLPDMKFNGTRAGAIHKVTMTGVVSL
jgi:hypothetical protein